MNDVLEVVGSLALRATVVYLGLLAMLRLAGRRELAQLTPADMLLLLLLSEAVSPALSGGHDHIWTALVSAVVLIALTFAIGWLTFRSPRFEELVEGNSIILVRNGKLDTEQLRKFRITDGQLRTFLHQHGLLRVDQIAVAYVEPSGKVTMVKEAEKPEPKGTAPHPESFDEVAALAEIKSRLEDLERVFQRKRRALHASGASGASEAAEANEAAEPPRTSRSSRASRSPHRDPH